MCTGSIRPPQLAERQPSTACAPKSSEGPWQVTITIECMPVFGMLGLGEAGGLIAADLRAGGATVRGYDPLPQTRPDVATPTAAASGADVVLSLTTAAEALDAARSVLAVLRPGEVYADAETSGSALKEEVGALVEANGGAVAGGALAR